MTRFEAQALAGRDMPNIWGCLRTAWISGFLGIPESGVAWYPGDSAAAQLRRRGAKDREECEKTKAADGPDPDPTAGERPQGSE